MMKEPILEPPVVTATDEEWRCEGCGRVILNGERVYLYADEDETAVAHIVCPKRNSVENNEPN
jgi:hypothetical protein